MRRIIALLCTLTITCTLIMPAHASQVSDDISDYEKVKRIYDYMCEDIVYNNKNLDDPSYELEFWRNVR